MKSCEFQVGCVGPCVLAWYPKGNNSSDGKHSSVFLTGPESLKVNVEIKGEVSGVETKNKFDCERQLPKTGQGWHDFFLIPESGTFVLFTVTLLSASTVVQTA